MPKPINQEISDCIKSILEQGKAAKVNITESVEPLPSNEYQHELTYRISGREKKDYPTTDDTEPIAENYAVDLIKHLKEDLGEVVILGPKANAAGDKAAFSVQYKNNFKVPENQVFTDTQAAQLLGLSLSELEKHMDTKVEIGELPGYRVNDIAAQKGISLRVLAERYQNLFKAQ